MAKEVSEIVGKKKKVVNNAIYGTKPTSGVNDRGEYTLDATSAYPILGGKLVFLNKGTDFYEENYNYLIQDRLRMALGKNWKLAPLPGLESITTPRFDNNWPAYAVFYDRGLGYEICGPIEEMTLSELQDPDAVTILQGDKKSGEMRPPSSFDSPESSNWRKIIYNNGLVTKQKIAVTCDLSDATAGSSQTAGDWLYGDQSTWPTLEKWAYLMKTGIVDQEGQLLWPLVAPSFYQYHDLYHVTSVPFTKKELLEKQPVGKGSFASVKTYYNERMRDRTYENFLTNYKWGYKSSTPSIYGLLHFLLQETNTEKIYDEFKANAAEEVLSQDAGGVIHTTPFLKYPLESMIISPLGITDYLNPPDSLGNQDTTLGPFQIVAQECVEAISKINPKKQDVQGSYEKYYREWTKAQVAKDTGSLFGNANFKHNMMERMFTNLSFSPYVLNIINKIEKYKKYFPFYSEIEFTAKLNTEIGDLIKKTLMTRYLSTKIAEKAGFGTDNAGENKFDFEPSGWTSRKFYDLFEEKVYKDINADSYLSETELSTVLRRENEINENNKNIFDITNALQKFVDDMPGYSYSPNNLVDEEDIQNYITFLDNGATESVDLSDHNPIFRKVFGNILLQKIIATYKQNRRSYEDLLNGVPAYTEDIFYRIEKYEKIVGGPEEEISADVGYRHVQNIIIPNTSDLDIVKYIDTQVKYGKSAHYKYNIYAERIVFGSKYRYFWLNSNNVKQYPKSHYNPGNINSLDDTPTAAVGGFLGGVGVNDFDPANNQGGIYTSNLRVKIEPHIVMMEDLLFTTPDIKILDRPPVAPDVNIIPYRAVNNRVKILFNGMIDRYRDFPIYINQEADETNFNLILEAQQSADGKVEFGSDDIITTYEIYRTRTRPKKYTDFTYYKTVAGTFFEEKILPNTKYYYTFRAIDSHNHISNPTAIYEVELIDESGAVKPLIRTIPLEIIETKTSVKECQKYILIKPVPQQVYQPMSGEQEIDYMFTEQATALDNFFGVKRNKKFKIRITSKSTGKKIDINLQFKRKGVPSLTEDVTAAVGNYSWVNVIT